MQIIIPMSGIGKRFVDAGWKVPKPLIEVDGKPIIEHVVNLFPHENNVTFICNDMHLKNTNMRETLLNIKKTAKIYEVSVNNRKGPVHAVSQIFQHISDEEEVIISYCDYGTWWDYEKFLETARKNEYDGSIAGYIGFHPHMLGSDNYAFMRTDENNNVLEIQEKKPFTDNKMNEYASNGTYYFKSGIILKKYFQKLMDLNICVKNEFYVSMVYNLLLKDGLNVSVFEIENMLQWGTPHDLNIYMRWSKYFSKLTETQLEYKDSMNTTLILPMAGRGSRFSLQGYALPKPLLNVNKHPMFIKAVLDLPDTVNKSFICLKEHVKEYPQIEQNIKNYFCNSKVIKIDQVTEGQACTCEFAMKDFCTNDPILISACDNGIYYDKKKYNNLLNDENVDVIVWSFRHNPASINNPDMYAWLDVDENDNIKYVSVKKCIFDDPYNNHAIIGTMFFRKAKYFLNGLNSIYQKNIRTNGEYYVDNILNELIDSGYNVKVFEADHYICWGTPDDYKTYNYWENFFDKCEWHPYKS